MEGSVETGALVSQDWPPAGRGADLGLPALCCSCCCLADPCGWGVRAAPADAAEPSADACGVASAALRMASVPLVLLPMLTVLLGMLGTPDAAGWLRNAMLPTLHSDMAARMRLSQSAAEVRGVIRMFLRQ